MFSECETVVFKLCFIPPFPTWVCYSLQFSTSFAFVFLLYFLFVVVFVVSIIIIVVKVKTQ